MARAWVVAGLAVLGLVAAMMAAGGLPWSLRPIGAAGLSTAPDAALAQVPTGQDAARQVTDLALDQLRRARAQDAPDPLEALTQTVVRDLMRGQGPAALERAVRRAPPGNNRDAYVAALRAEAHSGAPSNVTPVQARLTDSQKRPAPRP